MINLKYAETRPKQKFGTGFYIVIACCILLLGGASWFALSNIADNSDIKSKNENSEYTDKTPSYTESTPESAPQDAVEETEEKVSQVPYSSEPAKTESPQKPVFALPVQGEILKQSSSDALQYSATYGDMRLHQGVDIACELKSKIHACADGTVSNIELNTALGNVVTIDHGNKITVKYASLEKINVSAGDEVQLGDIIGTVGTIPSECNDKSHIHIEVFVSGKHADPLKALGLE